MESDKKSRIIWIDNAKGIAIILVIIGHTCYGLEGIWNFDFVYGIHLVMFLLLSGYTLRPHKLNKEYINKKFNRLMGPYFLTCFAVMVMDIFNSYFLSKNIEIEHITKIISNDLIRSFFASGYYKTFGSIDIGSFIGAIYYLPAFFFALLIFQLINGADDKTANDLRSGLISCGIAAIAYITARFIWLPFSIQSGMQSVLFIWMGYEIKKHNLLSRIRWYHYLAAQIILLYGIYFRYCSIYIVTASIADWIVSIPVALSGCLLIYLLSILNSKGKILPYIGRNSLEILCIHLFLINTCDTYIYILLNRLNLHGNAHVWARIGLNIILAIAGTAVINLYGKIYEKLREQVSTNKCNINPNISSTVNQRDMVVDVTRGILIFMMLVGHFTIDPTLRKIIYSCHMIAFIFLSGYFYRKSESIFESVKHMVKTLLIPYFLCMIFEILISLPNQNFEYEQLQIIKYIGGFSLSNKIFSDALSVGPIYFIPLLFCTRLLYILLDHICTSKQLKAFVVLCISLIGVHLAEAGYWLPWSFDVSCYALIFYALGVLAKEFNVLQCIKTTNILYFILSTIWAYMIYTGSMEIAGRMYGEYGLAVIGSLAGTLLIYKLSSWIDFRLPITGKFLSLAGKYSMIILSIHNIFYDRVIRILNSRGIRRGYLWNMTFAIFIQVIAGIIIGLLISVLKSRKTQKSAYKSA